MKIAISQSLKIIILYLFLFTTSCQANWQIEMLSPDKPSSAIDSDIVNFYVKETVDEGEDDDKAVSLSHILFHFGFSLIDTISLIKDGQTIKSFEWEEINSISSISIDGNIIVGDEVFEPASIRIMPSPVMEEIEFSILDIAPTVLSVLDLPPLSESIGESRSMAEAERAVMIFVDGLQYEKLVTMIEHNALPFFQTIDEIHMGITVYPSITTSSTAALITGLPPKDNGAYGYGYRSTDEQTIFDIANESGLEIIAVEGHGLAFNIRNAEVILSGDRNNDGYTNDNVLENSLDIIRSRMPDLLFIHFHDVDDAGHHYGPDSVQYENAIKVVDEYLSQIIEELPENTFTTIFSDHGMQADKDGSRGNHGYLTKDSMIIPIIFIKK